MTEVKHLCFVRVVTLIALLSAIPLHAQGQQLKNIPRIGYASAGVANNQGVLAFRQGLRELGYSEGKNILVEYRYAHGKTDRVITDVAELVKLKLDVLCVETATAVRAAKQATQTLPIVMTINEDPVATSLIDSLAHPGGNVTGISRLTVDLSGKRLELLKEILPAIYRVGVLFPVNMPSGEIRLKHYASAARALPWLATQRIEVGRENPDFEEAFHLAANAHVDALVTMRHGLINAYQKTIAALTIKNRLPSIHEGADFVDAGGLISYSANSSEGFKRAAIYVDKILKGAKPADLPVEQPTKFELAINLKTAEQIGLTIPPNVLARADRVIK